MIFGLIVVIILIVMGISLLRIGLKGDFDVHCSASGIFLLIGAIMITVAIFSLPYDSPTAIDVYRGKTTLQITYQDSIPVDSIVVFKPEFE